VTIAGVSGAPGVNVPPPVTFDRGKRFRRAVALLPTPLPAPVPIVLPEMTEATASRTCFPARLDVELSGGQRVGDQECDFPRTVLPACASLSESLPREYGCPRAHPGSAFSVDPAVEPELRPRDVARIVRQELGDGSAIEQALAVPSDVTPCAFVRGCPPQPRSGEPRHVWLVTAYDAKGVIGPPVYLIILRHSGRRFRRLRLGVETAPNGYV
jgi:hypothetical protein